jgi:hypothetical protein
MKFEEVSLAETAAVNQAMEEFQTFFRLEGSIMHPRGDKFLRALFGAVYQKGAIAACTEIVERLRKRGVVT